MAAVYPWLLGPLDMTPLSPTSSLKRLPPRVCGTSSAWLPPAPGTPPHALLSSQHMVGLPASYHSPHLSWGIQFPSVECPRARHMVGAQKALVGWPNEG